MPQMMPMMWMIYFLVVFCMMNIMFVINYYYFLSNSILNSDYNNFYMLNFSPKILW